MFRSRVITYAQNKEDLILWGYFHTFKKKGFYIDIGANDPVEDSVTNFFYIRGWSGINVEPQSMCHELLCKSRLRDINLQIGVSDKKGSDEITTFKNTGISTLNKVVASGYSSEDARVLTIKTDTLSDLIVKYAKNKEIHFLKIDVEGYEGKVVGGNDWAKYRPWVICIEHTWKPEKWSKILLKNDYVLHIFDGLNAFYVALERKALIDSYIVFSNSESIRFNDANTIRRVLPVARVVNKVASYFNGF